MKQTEPVSAQDVDDPLLYTPSERAVAVFRVVTARCLDKGYSMKAVTIAQVSALKALVNDQLSASAAIEIGFNQATTVQQQEVLH